MAITNRQEDSATQDGFLRILPEIRRLLRWCFRDEQVERRQEHVQEALCQAWAMYLPAHRRGKRLSAHGLAWYAWLATRSGRRFCWESKRSVKKSESLESLNLDELFACDGRARWPVPEQAAFRIDWPQFVGQRNVKERQAIALLAIGHRRSEAAALLGISRAWMTQHMSRVHRDWQEFSSLPGCSWAR